MTFSIFEHVEFNRTGRAICPSCLLTKGEGYRKYNLSVSLDPKDHGAYSCHRGCSIADIRSACGESKSIEKAYIPTALPPKPIEFLSEHQITQASNLLFNTHADNSKKALQYLQDRGLDIATIKNFNIGITYKKFKFGDKWENTPCLFIPYKFSSDNYLGKYFPNKWLPESDRPDQQMSQAGVSARWYFTHEPEGQELWICEGEWDALLLGQILYNNQSDISVCTETCGSQGIPKDLSQLKKYDRIVIFYDLDDSGKSGAKKLADAIGDRATIAIVPSPENPKKGFDITDSFGHFGDQLLPMMILAIAEVAEVAEVLERYDPDEPPISEHRDYTEEEKEAIAILQKAPTSITHDYEAFTEVGRSLKGISDYLFSAWYEWGWKHFSTYTADKGYAQSIWKELPSGGTYGDLINATSDHYLQPKTNKSAVKKKLQKMYNSRLRLNTMTHYVEQDGEPIKPDYIYLDLMDYGIESSKDFVTDNFFKLAEQNQYDPLTEYLEGCYAKYGDSTLHLLDNPAKTYLQTSEEIYDVYLRKTLIAAAARALSAGCKVDTVLVLHGEEGLQKTTFFEILAGQWFEGGLGGNVGDTNEMMKMAASWICEWGEIERIFGQKDTSTIKAFLTRREDVFRRPWGRTMQKTPRRSIIVASTNRDDFLSDPTGNRRYWVVKCEQQIAIDKLKADRDKLWAAAVAAFKLGEQWWLTKSEEALRTDKNKDFTSEEVWFEKIQGYVNSLYEGKCTTSEVLEKALKVEIAHQDRSGQIRVAKVLGELGWKKKKSHGVILWVKPESTEIQNQVSPVSPVSPSPSQQGTEQGDTLSFSNKKIESIPINRGTLETNNSGDTYRGILEVLQVSPVESLSTTDFQRSGDTRDTKSCPVSGSSLKVGDLVTIKAGGLSGRTGNIQNIAGNIATVTSSTFGMEQKIPLAHLEAIA